MEALPAGSTSSTLPASTSTIASSIVEPARTSSSLPQCTAIPCASSEPANGNARTNDKYRVSTEYSCRPRITPQYVTARFYWFGLVGLGVVGFELVELVVVELKPELVGLSGLGGAGPFGVPMPVPTLACPGTAPALERSFLKSYTNSHSLYFFLSLMTLMPSPSYLLATPAM